MRFNSYTSAVIGLAVLICARPATTRAEWHVYFGNLHSHTSYSDGSGTPKEAYEHAKDKAKLDFLAITEHNHAAAEGSGDRKDNKHIATDNSLYNGTSSNALIKAASSFDEPGRFVAIYGQEFSSISQGNHVNVFEVGDVIDVPNGEFASLFNQWLPAHPASDSKPAFIQLNHPRDRDAEPNEYGLDDFPSEAQWLAAISNYATLIEVLNGPALSRTSDDGRAERSYEGAYLTYLSLGLRVAPTGNQDNHYKNWGSITDVRSGVIADELSKPKILEALRSRHVYATEDRNLRAIVTVNGSLIGDVISSAPALGSPLDIRFGLSDDDEPDAGYSIQVYSGVVGGALAEEVNAIQRIGNTGNNNDSVGDVQFTNPNQYVFFKITQTSEDGPDDRVWTAPVWFGSGSGASSASAGTEVASKNSAVYHVSMSCASAMQIKEANRVFGAEAKAGRRLHQGCPSQ